MPSVEPLGEEFAGREAKTRQFQRPEVRWRLAGGGARDVYPKTAIRGEMALAAEMPLADGCGPVATWGQGFGNRFIRYWQKLIEPRGQEFRGGPLFAPGNPVGEVKTRGVLTGQDAGTRGRADGTTGVGVGETDALGSEAIDIRRIDETVAVGAQIAPAQVVHQDEQDVPGSLCGTIKRRGGCERCRCGSPDEGSSFHDWLAALPDSLTSPCAFW